MAAAEMRAAWQRTAATCYLLHEDTKRGSKAEPQQNTKEDPQKNSKFEAQVAKSDEYSHLFGSSEGWSTINAQYLLDRKPDFHFQAAEPELRKHSSDSGSEWETVELSSSAAHKDSGVQTETADLSSKTVQGSTPQPLSAPRKIEERTQDWRNADQGKLAALIAKSSSGDLKNCDLPSNKSRVDASRSVRKEEAVRLSRSLDNKVIGAVLPGEEQSCLPTQPVLVAQLDRQPLDLMRMKYDAQQVLSPSSKKQEQQDQRSTVTEIPHWTSLVPEGKAELLGEALCRSQTRAREAEQRAGEAVKEKELLLRLFFREASISLAYKHWVKFLQAENRWLRSRVTPEEDEDEVAAEKPCSDVSPLQQMPISRKASRKTSGHELVKFKKRRCSSEHSVAVLACTVGLAFALGVGLAGAGIFFGCTVGHCIVF